MKPGIRTILSLVICSVMFMACNDNSGSSAQNGFSNGHKLKGRYVNTEQGIRSFTFKTDGSFARGGAVSGTARGTDYVASSHESGTYTLNGNNLKVTYENGDTEDLPIELFSYNAQSDYSQETPTRLRINNMTYVNVDE